MNRSLPVTPLSLSHDRDRVTLVDTLDRVLNKGAVIVGDLTISVAGIDLVHVGLNLVVGSVETLRRPPPSEDGS